MTTTKNIDKISVKTGIVGMLKSYHDIYDLLEHQLIVSAYVHIYSVLGMVF